jgi:hypothetical protein
VGPALDRLGPERGVLRQPHSGLGDPHRRDLLRRGRLDRGEAPLDQQEEESAGEKEGEREPEQQASRDAAARIEAPPEALEGKWGFQFTVLGFQCETEN